MNTAGGFLLEPNAQAGSSSNPAYVKDGNEDNDGEEDGSIKARKLTAKQEVRLMNYLDEEILRVNRGFNKRHSSKTSSVPTLDAFLQAYRAIIDVVASIPPIGSSVPLLVGYLLRLTSELLDGIAGYEIAKTYTTQVTHDTEEEKEEEDFNVNVPLSTNQLQSVIQCLTLVDKVWSYVLKGQMIDIKAAKRNVEKDFTESDDLFPSSSRGRSSIATTLHKKDEQSIPGRYAPLDKSSHIKEARSIIGSKGFASVAQTDRIRLRNVITLGKENLFAWMRIQLNVPLPPPQEAAEEGQDEGKVSEVMQKKETLKVEEMDEANGSETEEDLEEVDTDKRSGLNGIEEVYEGNQDGNRHFDELFARKIDPDASDIESGSDTIGEENDKHSASPPIDEPTSKRSRRARPPSSTTFNDDGLDVESIATFSNTSTVMKWDIKFARLFASTLRCLSDIQEYRNQRDAANQRSAGDSNNAN